LNQEEKIMSRFMNISAIIFFVLPLACAGSFAADTIKICVQAATTGKYANEGQGIDRCSWSVYDPRNNTENTMRRGFTSIEEDDRVKQENKLASRSREV